MVCFGQAPDVSQPTDLRTIKPMLEQEFIEKWRGDVTGMWTEDADALFWARSYKLEKDDPEALKEMCEDYMSVPLSNRAPCCRDKVRNVLGWA